MVQMLTKHTVPAPSEDMEHDQILQMRLSGELKKALDELRRREPDLPSRSEMIRRLIEKAIATKPPQRGKQ